MKTPLGTLYAVGVSLLALLLTACVIPTQIAKVSPAVGTVVQTGGIVDVNVSDDCSQSVPPSPNVQSWWNGLGTPNQWYPFVGFEIWRNTFDGCETTRLDVYRALVTFNLSSVSQWKGLLKTALLYVSTRALPAGFGTDPNCIKFTGGAGTLDRFGPTVTGLPVVGGGMLTQLQSPTPFPVGINTVFVFPKPWKYGPVAGAANPTTTLANGLGGAAFTVDVTTQVDNALYAGRSEMSWMLTSALEGPLTAPLPTSVDCKTSYDLVLSVEHYLK
jgi:hypothetical protein